MKERTVFSYPYAGHDLRYRFRFPTTRYFFRPLPAAAEEETWDICVSDETLQLGRNFLPSDSSDAYVEYRCLIELTARALLRWHCSIFHAVSFVWRGRAWLLTAPSGVGKTTQFRNWQRLFPGEIEMISGDMPVLEARDDGRIWVWPSPWNGKEDIHSRLNAPLGGIVLLEQADVDEILPLSARDGVLSLLRQFMVSPVDREEILALTSLLEQMFLSCPVWRLRNRGGDASTCLLRSTLEGCLMDGGGQQNGTI